MNAKWDEFQQLVCDHLGMEQDEVGPQTNLYTDLGIDSLGVVSLGLVTQKHFQVQLPLASLTGISTLGGLCELLVEHLVDHQLQKQP
ncbi:acyl carrier protein [Salinibius halmophilus]|uniref:acyl carrier protein n=1 Tax=Salinibius halmophilus TaxID=1853216 RepID=UPI000E666E63|nr:acyl carrier protein [Salinibius halmophilus]